MYHPNITKLRHEKGYSLQKLASLSGVSKSYIWQLEKRDKHPAADILMKLAAALDTTVTELMSSKDAPGIQLEPPKTGTYLKIKTTNRTIKGKYLGVTKIAGKRFITLPPLPKGKDFLYINIDHIVTVSIPS